MNECSISEVAFGICIKLRILSLYLSPYATADPEILTSPSQTLLTLKISFVQWHNKTFSRMVSAIINPEHIGVFV